MIHTSAFGGLSTSLVGTIASGGVAAYKQLPPPIDGLLSVSGASALQLPSDLMVIAAFAADAPTVAGWYGRARINAPSLLRVGYPFIYPMQMITPGGILPVTPNPNLAVFLDNPIRLKAAEPVAIEMATTNGSTSDYGVALLWFCDRLSPIPSGASLDGFWLHYSVSSAANLVAGAWAQAALTLDQNLPQGNYAVVGFAHFGPTAIAARLSFPGSPFKPGTLAQNGGYGNFVADAKTDRIFLDGSLGIMGMFQTYALPSLEILVGTSEPAANHEGFLRVIRMSDASISAVGCGCP